jgi:hypothetical protein
MSLYVYHILFTVYTECVFFKLLHLLLLFMFETLIFDLTVVFWGAG